MMATSIVRLDRDHAEAAAHLTALHAAVGRLAHEPTPGALDATGEALAYFETAFCDHMAMEDRGVLPTLEAAMGAWCALPAWMRREHGEIRSMIRRVRNTLDRADGDRDRARALADEVGRLDALLTIHVHREDHLLFPIAKLVLDPEQWTAIDRAIA